MVENGDWDDLLRRVNVRKGDFFYVPSGTIHAIGKGIMILETQQSSDITYRVYDYDRTDGQGNKRELHIQSSAEVTRYPHDVKQQVKTTASLRDLTMTCLVKADYFTVYHWQLDGIAETPLQKDYLLASVIGGKGEMIVDGTRFAMQTGDHLILPASVRDYELKGTMELIVSHE